VVPHPTRLVSNDVAGAARRLILSGSSHLPPLSSSRITVMCQNSMRSRERATALYFQAFLPQHRVSSLIDWKNLVSRLISVIDNNMLYTTLDLYLDSLRSISTVVNVGRFSQVLCLRHTCSHIQRLGQTMCVAPVAFVDSCEQSTWWSVPWPTLSLPVSKAFPQYWSFLSDSGFSNLPP
jgi:hypothetical protein